MGDAKDNVVQVRLSREEAYDAIQLERRLANLAACLREAAGLCKSFMEGEYHERGMWCGGWRQRESWAPGCGTSAPGFEGK